MTISQAPATINYSAVPAGSPLRIGGTGPILYKTTMGGSAWVVGQLVDLETGQHITDEPSPSAACKIVPGAFVEQI